MPQPPHDAANWFEIPTTDLDRAARFYGQLLATTSSAPPSGTQSLSSAIP